MNERIRTVSASGLLIERNAEVSGRTRLDYTGDTLAMCSQYDIIDWDAEGRAALIEALQCLRDTGSFAALRSPPTYRPMTPAEAVKQFKRRAVSKHDPIREHEIDSVSSDGVFWKTDYSKYASTFAQLVDNWRWTDTNEPCGVRED